MKFVLAALLFSASFAASAGPSVIYKARMEIAKPVSLDAMNNDFQKAIIVKETDKTVIVDFTITPVASYDDQIKGDPNWRSRTDRPVEYLKPGVTSNFDDALKKDLIARLKKAGVDVDALDDKALVQEVTNWIIRSDRFVKDDMFIYFDLNFSGPQPAVFPQAKSHFDSEAAPRGFTNERDALTRAFGRGLYNAGQETGYRGACTTTSILISTVLKALGIPTRSAFAVLIADVADADQVDLVIKGLDNSATSNAIKNALLKYRGQNTWASHTFNEVFINGRWVTLNYNIIGQGPFWEPMGLLVQTHRFFDWSESRLPDAYGLHMVSDKKTSANFKYNPYRILSFSTKAN